MMTSSIVVNNAIVLISRSEALADALNGIIHHRIQSVEDLPTHTGLRAAILDADYARQADVSWVRRAYPTAFIAVFNPAAAHTPQLRISCFDAGANMIAHDVQSIIRTLTEAVLPLSGLGHLTCPYCQLPHLTANELFFHAPAYHINWPNDIPVGSSCPICRKSLHQPLQVHIHEHHRPEHLPFAQMAGVKINQLYHFALLIVRLPGTSRYLLVQEFGNEGFWCPGGAVDVGETVVAAAHRECLEEAGIAVKLKGILSLELHNAGLYDHRLLVRNRSFGDAQTVHIVRMRVIFYAEPVDSGPINSDGLCYPVPKSSPDYESAGACWVDYADIQSGAIKMRGSEPKKWSKYMEEGGTVYPLTILNERHA